MKNAFLKHALECECCSAELDILHDVIAESDRMVAKALMVSEVARIVRIEVRMRDFLLSKWRLRADQASVRAGRIVAGGGKLSAAHSSIDKVMRTWRKDVESRSRKDVGEIYKLARTAGHKKANGQTTASLQYVSPNFTDNIGSGKEIVRKAKRRIAAVKPSFDVVDAGAIKDLQDDYMIWIGRHYDENVRGTIRTAVSPSVLGGVSRAEAGRRVADIVGKELRKVTVPKGFNGSDAKYFEGLAANTATNARARGQIRSFETIGVTRYEIVNPMDDRTSEICQFMNGRIFEVREASSQIERLSNAKTPDDVRSVHPWLSKAKAQSIFKRGGERALARSGLSLPPYHFRCRSTVDISTESISFGDLE